MQQKNTITVIHNLRNVYENAVSPYAKRWACPILLFRFSCFWQKIQNIVDAAVERFVNFLNTIERNIIVTLDTGNYG